MLFSSIKNYFRHIRYVFLIMGVFYLSLLVLIYGVYLYLKGLVLSNQGTFLTEIEDIVRELVLTVDIGELLSNGVGIFVDRFLQLMQQKFDANIGDFVAIVTAYSAIVVLACQIGVYLCRYSIRRDIKDHNAKNFVVAFLLRLLLNLTFAGLFAYLVYRFWYSVVLLIAIFFVLRAFFDMIEAKVLYFGDKKFFEVINLKNIFECIASYVLFFVLTVGVIVALWIYTNILIAGLIGVPMLLYLFEAVRYTSVEYLIEK